MVKVITTKLCKLVSVFLLGVSSSALALTIVPEEKGLAINGKNELRMVLSYPRLLNASNKDAVKLIEKNITETTVTLKYENGCEAIVTISPDNSVQFQFSGVPADVTKYLCGTILPRSLEKGGSWKMTGEAQAFPVERSNSPHLYQGGSRTVTFQDSGDGDLTVTLPVGSYQELADNRHYGWSAFSWRFFVPYNKDNLKMILTFSQSTN